MDTKDKTGTTDKETAVEQKDTTKENNSKTGTNSISDNKSIRLDEKSKSEKPSETEKGGSLYKFFTDALKDIYFAEKHILEALPKMQKAATTSELQEAFEDHYLMTQKHVSRLEKVFKLIGEQAEAKKCEAIIGIVKEGETCIKDTEDDSMTRDAALIIAAQKVEHYEIATYGGLVALAETLGLYDAADLLHTTLDEEEQTDYLLTDIAESYINFAAKDDETDEDSDSDDDQNDENY